MLHFHKNSVSLLIRKYPLWQINPQHTRQLNQLGITSKLQISETECFIWRGAVMRGNNVNLHWSRFHEGTRETFCFY